MNFRILLQDIKSLNVKSFRYRFNKIVFFILKTVHKLIKKRRRSLRDIPVIINNRNRYTYLLKLINWLEAVGMKNIYIIDNNSNYPPLLNYYKTTKYKVFRLKKNYGYLALWQTNIFTRFESDFYIYTDPDILPIEECPADFIEFFMHTLDKYKLIGKVGFGLKIDDLPDCYALKEDVINHESQFWQVKIADNIYDAQVDTTFALYRPYTEGGNWLKAYRTGEPYTARHLPWYTNTHNLDEEDEFYLRTASKSSSWMTYQKVKFSNG